MYSIVRKYNCYIMYDNWILWAYRKLKNFSDPNEIITASNTGSIKKPDINHVLLHFGVYGIIPAIILIMLISSVINYEMLFQSTKDYNKYKEKLNSKIDNNYEDYYSIPENQMGRNVYAPLITGVIIVFIGGIVYYQIKPQK